MLFILYYYRSVSRMVSEKDFAQTIPMISIGIEYTIPKSRKQSFFL